MSDQTGIRLPAHSVSDCEAASAAKNGLLRWLGRQSTYHFHDCWLVDGDISEISHVFFHSNILPIWWAQFRSVRTMTAGDSAGVGRHVRSQLKGYLPYRLQLDFRVIRVQYPVYFEVQVEGDFDGHGCGRLREAQGRVEIDLRLNIRVRRTWLQLLSVVARPLLVAQHVWTMGQGRSGLNRELVRRRRAHPASRN